MPTMKSDSRLGAVPPLPLLQDGLALAIFWCESLDDCVEDLVKVAAALLLLALARSLARQLLPKSALVHGVLMLLVLSWYPLVDRAANVAGELITPLQRANAICPALHESRRNRSSHTLRPASRAASNLVDEVVEDVAKLLCVSSHAYVGLLLHSAVAHAPSVAVLPPRLRGFTSWLLMVGPPAAQYQACDEWSDALGDAAHGWALRLLRRDPHRQLNEEDAPPAPRRRKIHMPWDRSARREWGAGERRRASHSE